MEPWWQFFQEINPVQWVTIAAAFVFGVELALLGSIKLPLAKQLNLDETQIGGMLSVLNFALIPMLLISGVILDLWSMRWIIVAGSVLTSLGILGLAWARDYGQSLLAVLLAGFAGASLSVAASKLMPVAFFPGNPAAAINLGNVFFGFGALLTPLVVTILFRILGYRSTVSLVALLFLAPAALVGLASPEQWPQLAVQPDQWQNLLTVLEKEIFWAVGIALFFYVPLEFAVGTWATTYLTGLGIRERRASMLLSGFWLVFMLARLGATFLLVLFDQRGWMPGAGAWLVVGLALASAILLAIMVSATDRGRARLSVLLLGLCFGPIFPTLIGLLFHGTAKSLHGTAFGASFSLGLIGSALITPLIGRIARKRGIQRGLGVTVVVAIILGAVSIALAFFLF